MTQEILSYSYLKNKASREIKALETAIKEQNMLKAQDAALNAAFSVFHLLEWRNKEANPASKEGARKLAKESGNAHLSLLHDVVTMQKHGQISAYLITKKPDVKSQSSGGGFTRGITQAITRPITSDVTGATVLKIHFSGKDALQTLQGAYRYFDD